MVFFANFYGIVFGLIIGVCLALMIMAKWIKDSNDIGDKGGEFMDFGDYVRPINCADNLSNPWLGYDYKKIDF